MPIVICLVPKCPVVCTWVGEVSWGVFAKLPPQQKPVCLPLGPLLPGRERASLADGAFASGIMDWGRDILSPQSPWGSSAFASSLSCATRLGRLSPWSLQHSCSVCWPLTPATGSGPGCSYMFSWKLCLCHHILSRESRGWFSCLLHSGGAAFVALWVATISPIISVVVKYDQFLMREFGLWFPNIRLEQFLILPCQF